MMLQRFRPETFDLPTLRSDPFRGMDRFFNDKFFAPMFSISRAFDRDRWMPAMDVTEEDDAYRATVELPGLKKEDVEISVEKNVITLSGERKWETQEGKEEQGHFRRVERAYGKFERRLALPRTVKADSVKAKFKDGVLELTLPKAAEAKAHRIDIH